MCYHYHVYGIFYEKASIMKKFLSGIWAGCLALSASVPVWASTFSDVPETHWAQPYVEVAVESN